MTKTKIQAGELIAYEPAEAPAIAGDESAELEALLAASQIESEWLESCKTDRTRATYRESLKAFRAWAVETYGDLRIDPVGALLNSTTGRATRMAQAWAASMREAGRSPSTINTRISALVSLAKAGRVSREGNGPLILIKRETVERYKDALALDMAALDAIDAASADDPVSAARNRALVALMTVCLLRRAEVASLRLQDVNLKTASIAPIRKRSTERRWIEVSAEVCEALAAWLQVRPCPCESYSESERDALFVTLAHGVVRPMTAAGLSSIIKGLKRKTGIDALRPHNFRHLGATTTSRAGVSNAALRDALGHKSLSAVDAYVAQTSGAARDVGDVFLSERRKSQSSNGRRG